MTERQDEVIDAITARMGEFFKDYVVLVRTDKPGGVSWRSSDPNWAESAARHYVNYVQFGNHLQQMDDFHRRD